MSLEPKKKILYVVLNTLEKIGGGPQYEKGFIEILERTGKFDIQILEGDKIDPKGKGWKFLSLFRFAKCVKKQGKKDFLIVTSITCAMFLSVLSHRLFRRKTKIYAILHHPIYQNFWGIRKFIARFLEFGILRCSHKIIFADRPIYENSPYIKNKEKILLEIPVQRQEIPDVKKVPNRICYIGRINRHKGADKLAEALNLVKQEIPDFDARLIGDDKRPDSLKFVRNLNKYIEKNGLAKNIKIHGVLPEQEKNEILASSKFLVFPSHAEGYGLCMSEAMQFGIPVIAWDVSVMPYTVKHEQNGLLVKHNDIRAFADAIIRLYKDDELCERLSQGALEHSKTFNRTEEFEEQVTLFADALNETDPSSPKQAANPHLPNQN